MKKIIYIVLIAGSSIFAQEGKYGFTIKGGLNFPVSDFNNYYNASFGGFGGIFYNFSETGRVSGTIGYNAWSLDLDALNEDVKNSGNSGSYNIEAPISAIPILINIKFFLRSEMSMKTYFLLEGGIYKITREVYGKYIDENGSSSSVTPRSDKTTNGSINLGIGIEYPLNETIYLDVSARYHYLLHEDVYNFGEAGYASSYSTINFISLYAGLNILFE